MHLGYDLYLHSHLGLEFDATDLIAESQCHFNNPPPQNILIRRSVSQSVISH